MVKVIINNKDVGVSYDGGMLYTSPLNNQWLWLIGALEAGERIEVQDHRTELEDHQHNMTFTLNKR